MVPSGGPAPKLRFFAFVFGVCLGGQAAAQAPDVRVKLDGIYTVRSEENGPWTARFYDVLGNRGVLGITLYLEPGFRAFVAQRLQPIRNDPDIDPFDEYYIEDEGLWRIGKQYLPFGSLRILRESVVAARGDTNLVFEGLPLIVAACDGGQGRQRGFVGRLGGQVGVSLAIGSHFGIGSTTLNYVRSPEDSPGINHGYRLIYGFDARQNLGTTTFRAEFVAFRQAEILADADETILDLNIATRFRPGISGVFGLTRSQRLEHNIVRMGMSLRLQRNLNLEPLVRLSGRDLYDISVSLRFNL